MPHTPCFHLRLPTPCLQDVLPPSSTAPSAIGSFPGQYLPILAAVVHPRLTRRSRHAIKLMTLQSPPMPLAAADVSHFRTTSPFLRASPSHNPRVLAPQHAVPLRYCTPATSSARRILVFLGLESISSAPPLSLTPYRAGATIAAVFFPPRPAPPASYRLPRARRFLRTMVLAS
ncbi:hypothetical protein R3P38DRAFT_3211850 [Favolaschia claudopus]|uniref:Uncharacterized protein n=1 Tax=Favolaschia claudopus TaxID=2862362 RepID=A0AAW0AFE6_9AGAR